MGKYYSVRLPVKPYIKKYMIFLLGDEIRLTQDHHIKSYLLILLEKRRVGRYRWKDIMHTFTDEITLWISWDVWNNIGFDIPQSKVVNFAYFIEDHFTEALYSYVSYQGLKGVSKKASIEAFCDNIGITPDDIDYDSLRRKLLRNEKKYAWVDNLKKSLPPQSDAFPLFACPSPK